MSHRQFPPPACTPANDLSASLRHSTTHHAVSSGVRCILVPLFLLGIAVSIFILVAVHNALFLVCLLSLFALVVAFVLWNDYSSMRNSALVHFVESFPLLDLSTARDGQLVKVTGFVSCGNISLESSYEKVPQCVYTSTLLYEYFGLQTKPSYFRHLKSNLAYSERFVVDFYITDAKSRLRVMVKAGYNSPVIPLIKEITLVKTTSKNMILSSTLVKWLGERHLSTEACLLCLKEGYVKEGSLLTVMGVLSRNDGIMMIVPPPGGFSTGCLLQKLLLPININGLILSASNNIGSTMGTCSSQTL